MKAKEIINAIESEDLNIHSPSYSSQRDVLDEMISDELENGDVIAYARSYMAAARRAMLHSLQFVDAPDDAIESIFAK